MNGGIVEESFQIEFHNAAIALNKPAYFFLKSNQDGRIKLTDPGIGYACENSDKSSFVYFNGIKFKKQIFEDEIIQVTKFQKLSIKEYERLFKENSFLRNDTCNILTNLRTDNSIEFSFDSVYYTENFQYIEFDVMARVNTPGLKFARGDIYITYSNTFGSNAVNEGILKVFEGVITSNNLYSITYKDSTSQTIKVSVNSSVGSNNLYTFSNAKASILHLKFKIEDFTQLANISFDDITVNSEVYYWCQGQYHLFDQVGISGPITSVSSVNPIGITYAFENGQVTNNNTKFSFDIMATATTSSQYSDAFLYINYNELGFGSNVFANGKVSFQQLDLLSNTNVYQTYISDYDENTIQLVVVSSSVNGLSTLGTTSRNLGKMTFDILECEAEKGISFDPTTETSDHVHYTGTMPIPYELYSPIVADGQVNGSICNCSTPIITAFSPETIHAGNEEILTITGSNFGTYKPLSSTVMFRDGDADNGYMVTSEPYFKWDNIIHWTDNEIKVKVPSNGEQQTIRQPAASGKFKVRNFCYEESISDEVLTIPYSLLNVQFGSSNLSLPKKLVLQGDEPNHNGMEFRFSSSIPSSGVGATVRSAFRSALEEWCTATNVNFTIGDDISNIDIAVDNFNVIKYSDDLSPEALASVVISGHNNVNECTTNTVSMIDLDVKVKFDASASYDKYKNIFLHELGHAHLLNHSRHPSTITNWNTQYLMYYSVFPPEEFPAIRQSDKDGALNVFTRSALCTNGIGQGNCETNSTKNTNNTYKPYVYPNPTSNQINFEPKYSEAKASLTNSLGQIIFKGKATNDSIDVSHLLPGIYILSVEINGIIYVQKIIKL